MSGRTELQGSPSRKLRWVLCITVSALGVTIMTSFFSWGLIGTDGWSGLGQWVGGLGSFAAVGAAMVLAYRDSSRQQRLEKQLHGINAYYVYPSVQLVKNPVLGSKSRGFERLEIINSGTYPVVKVRVLAFRAASTEVLKVRDTLRKAVLIPKKPWRPTFEFSEYSEMETGDLKLRNFEFLIEFEDLTGTLWSRWGEKPPKKGSQLTPSGQFASPADND
jgi:hypothetical protein